MDLTINTLEKVIKEKNILQKHHLDRIGIFGSLARGENANDIDFYIDVESFDLCHLKELKDDLEAITEKRVDIMLKKYANPIILYRAQKDMKYVTGWKKWSIISTEYSRVYEIIKIDLPILKLDIETIICKKINQNVFDIDELKIAQYSKYYKHVDFGNIIKL